MNIKRSLAVAKRVFHEMRHDRRTVALMLFAPIFAMFIFGLAFSGEVQDVKLIIVNDDHGMDAGQSKVMISEQVAGSIDENAVTIERAASLDKAIGMVEDGEAYGVLYFPANFTRDLMMKLNNSTYEGNSNILLKLDKSNVNVWTALAQEVNKAVMDTMEERGQQFPISVDTSDAIYGSNADFMDFFVPGIMAFVVYILTTLLTLLTFVGERTSGTLERIMTTPVRASEIVLGYVITFSVVGMIQAATLLIIGIVVFDVLIVGNVALAFLVIVMLAIVCQAMGIMLSALAQREAQAIQFFPFNVMPAFLLSGIFWPLEAIPYWLRPASYIIPVTYAINATRAVMLKGWGLSRIWPELLALAGFAVVFMFLAFATLKRKKE